MAFFTRSFFNVLCIAAFLCSFRVLAAEDEYLKMLEGEAEKVELDQSGQIHEREQIDTSNSGVTKTVWKWEGDMEGDTLPSGLAQDELVALLKQNFYGTFVFYRKLNSNDQQTVYYHYSQNSPVTLDFVRQEILKQIKN